MSIGSVYHISQSTNNATNDVNSDSTWRKKSSPQMKLYDGHEPTSWLQRIILTVGSGLGGITYPKRDGKCNFNDLMILQPYIIAISA